LIAQKPTTDVVVDGPIRPYLSLLEPHFTLKPSMGTLPEMELAEEDQELELLEALPTLGLETQMDF